MSKIRDRFINAAFKQGFLPGAELSRDDIRKVCSKQKVHWPSWLTKNCRVGHDRFKLPGASQGESTEPKGNKLPEPLIKTPERKGAPVSTSDNEMADKMTLESTTDMKAVIPEKNPHFVKFGYYDDIERIIKSELFFPVYIYGYHGMGKTEFVHQACAVAKRGLIRVNLCEDMTVDQLIGGFRLIDGETKFYVGPVLQAMQLGCVLLLDEGDQAVPTIMMALQPVLEGKPYYIKETGKMVYPEPGFTVVLCANTRGDGDETGLYIGAQAQNAANLDRYLTTFQAQFPSETVERKLLMKWFKSFGVDTSHDFVKSFATALTKWSKNIRDAYEKQATDDLISTRRLIHIAKTFAVFPHKTKAIQMCISRYPETYKWDSLFEKIDPDNTIQTMEEWDEREKIRKEMKDNPPEHDIFDDPEDHDLDEVPF